MLDEIVITASRGQGSDGTDFSLKSIEAGRNVYIPDVLKNEPEVDIRRRTAVSDNADMLAIRGFSANRILLNLNGRSLNAAGVVGGYYIDWSTLPLDSIERIQIIKGGSDVKYGNNALGGVVNILTRKPDEKMRSDFFANYGVSRDMDYVQNYRVANSWKRGVFGYSVSGSYSKADEFLWNNDYEAKNGAGNFYLDMPCGGELALGAQFTQSRRGFIRNNRRSLDPNSPDFQVPYDNGYPLAFGETIAPASGNQNIFQPGPGSFWDKRKTYLDLSYKQLVRDWSTEMRIYRNIEDRYEKNYSTRLINSAYADGLLVLDRKVESDRSWGGLFELSRGFERHELSAGVEYKYLGFGDIDVYYYDKVYNNNASYAGGPASQEGEALAYYVKDSFRVTDKLTLSPGVRLDDYRVDPTNGSTVKTLSGRKPSLSLTAAYAVTPSDQVSLSVYNKYRTPGMPEVYWWSAGITGGNPELKSENNRALELALRHRSGGGSLLGLSAYYYSVKDYIMFRTDLNSGSGRAVYNIDGVDVWGASADYRAMIKDGVKVYANATVQDSRKGSDLYDSQRLLGGLDYLPPFKSNVGAEVELPFSSALSANWRFVDKQKAVYSYKTGTYQYHLAVLKAYNTVDLEYKATYKKVMQFSVYCDNVFGERYQEKYGYPMPGTTVGFTAKLSI